MAHRYRVMKELSEGDFLARLQIRVNIDRGSRVPSDRDETLPRLPILRGKRGASLFNILSDMLRRALDFIRVEFEDSTWQAFWATIVGQLPARDVADQFGMTPHAVRQAKYRLLRRLREELGEAVSS